MNQNTNDVERTSLGLRNALFDELDDLRAGKSTPKKASSVARVAGTIINSVKIEIEHQKHISTLSARSEDTSSLTITPVLKLGNHATQLPG